jgi:hypothetical protein
MLFVVVAVVAIAICLVLRGRHPGFQAVAVTCVVIACLFLEFLSPSPKRAVSSPGVPTEGNISEMVTSKTCRKCHPGAFDSWHRTFHRTMTQRVSPEVVEAPFDGESVVLHGQSYTFYRQNGEFRVEMPEVEIPVFSPENRPNTMPATLPVRSYPIVMCTGSHHVQLYWVDAGRISVKYRFTGISTVKGGFSSTTPHSFRRGKRRSLRFGTSNAFAATALQAIPMPTSIADRSIARFSSWALRVKPVTARPNVTCRNTRIR